MRPDGSRRSATGRAGPGGPSASEYLRSLAKPSLYAEAQQPTTNNQQLTTNLPLPVVLLVVVLIVVLLVAIGVQGIVGIEEQVGESERDAVATEGPLTTLRE